MVLPHVGSSQSCIAVCCRLTCAATVAPGTGSKAIPCFQGCNFYQLIIQPHGSDSNMRTGVRNYSVSVGTPLSHFHHENSPFTEQPRVKLPSRAESKNQLSTAGTGKSESTALHPCSSLVPTSFDVSLISS